MREIVSGVALSFALLLAAAAPPVAADEPGGARGVRYAQVPPDLRGEIGFDPRESAGLFVGIRSFEDSLFAEVPYAVDDAVDLAHLFALRLQLIDPQNVVLCLSGAPQKPESAARREELVVRGATLSSARKPDLIDYLDRQRRATGRRGLFVAAFATHGFTDQGAGYLIAEDSRRRRITDTGLALAAIDDDVTRAKARRRLVFVDACRERVSTRTRSLAGPPMTRAFVDALARASGFASLQAATADGFAYDDAERGNGVFTAAVIDGLSGAAPPNEQNLITVEGLAGYVNRRVRDWIADHRPEHRERSQGITATLEATVAQMPLAIDPRGVELVRLYEQRRRTARDSLREHIGSRIDGRMYDEIRKILEQRDRRPEVQSLLGEIEALYPTRPGTPERERAQRAFVTYYEEHRPELLRAAPKRRRFPSRWVIGIGGAVAGAGAAVLLSGGDESSPDVGVIEGVARLP